MAKATRALSGAAKDAYLRRTLRAEPELADPVRERLAERLKGEIASLSLKAAVVQDGVDVSSVSAEPAVPDTGAPATDEAVVVAPAASLDAAPVFDPYNPNVVVVFRTRGRDAALAELASIGDADRLRLLAREQQLGIAAELTSPGDICLAIVSAAERRIANRRAAAS